MILVRKNEFFQRQNNEKLRIESDYWWNFNSSELENKNTDLHVSFQYEFESNVNPSNVL